MKCRECEKDNNFCIYCQRFFTYLHRHINKMHQDTIRQSNCESKRGNT
jgi:hypothetical protein